MAIIGNIPYFQTNPYAKFAETLIFSTFQQKRDPMLSRNIIHEKKNWPETGKSEHRFHWIPSGKRSHNYSMENHNFVAG